MTDVAATDFVFEDGACVNARLHTSSGFTPTRPDSGRAALGDRTELWHSYYEALVAQETAQRLQEQIRQKDVFATRSPTRHQISNLGPGSSTHAANPSGTADVHSQLGLPPRSPAPLKLRRLDPSLAIAMHPSSPLGPKPCSTLHKLHASPGGHPLPGPGTSHLCPSPPPGHSVLPANPEHPSSPVPCLAACDPTPSLQPHSSSPTPAPAPLGLAAMLNVAQTGGLSTPASLAAGGGASSTPGSASRARRGLLFR
ncbi:hypothetical protein V8C86DRAFT_2476475 [Haematococcus lacustris]